MFLRKAGTFVASIGVAAFLVVAVAGTSQAASVERGKDLYMKNCAVCHGDKGQGRGGPMGWFTGGGGETTNLIGNQLNNQNFLAMASDEYLKETIKRGRPGRPMPSFKAQFSEQEIEDIVAFLRSWQKVDPISLDPNPVWGNPEDGKVLFKGACASCHGVNGEGTDFGPALNNQVFLELASDDFIRQTIIRGRPGTVMKPFLKGSDLAVAELEPYQINDIVSYIRTWDKRAREKLEPWLLPFSK